MNERRSDEARRRADVQSRPMRRRLGGMPDDGEAKQPPSLSERGPLPAGELTAGLADATGRTRPAGVSRAEKKAFVPRAGSNAGAGSRSDAAADSTVRLRRGDHLQRHSRGAGGHGPA